MQRARQASRSVALAVDDGSTLFRGLTFAVAGSVLPWAVALWYLL